MKEEQARETTESKRKGQQITMGIWFTVGMICLVLGAIGIVLPIMPTTPFLLASAACFCKSSPRIYNWLLGNKLFGEYIKNYREGKGIPLKTKITALTLLWTTIVFSTIFLLNHILPIQLVLPMQLIMMSVAIGVSIHILRLPTFKNRML